MNEQNNSLAENIMAAAQVKNKTIATAESITGGRIASSLTSVSGSSKVFSAGVVCYSEHSKVHSAGVDVRLINEVGVYNEKVVQQMAERIAKRNVADIGVATSGCAEEGDESCEKGTVFFAFAERNQKTKLCKKQFSGTRNEIQEHATQFALQTLLEIIENAQ